MLDNFDDHSSVSTPSGAHHPPSYQQDVRLIVEELQQSKIFDVVPKRKHQHFSKPKTYCMLDQLKILCYGYVII